MEQKLITIEQARKTLGNTGKKMSAIEIEKLINKLYSFINQILDNNISFFHTCKKH